MNGPKPLWPHNPNRNVDHWSSSAGSSMRGDSASTVNKMQHQYWVTKQTVFRKLGKKEDECIVASDAELDAKLELLRSIQDSCAELRRVIDRYQERLFTLAQEEDTMGRFLKEAGKHDKTKAGQMMNEVGDTLSYSGQKRISLRKPLVRLYQEVETFRHSAIEDMLENVQAMEKARTEYRASLNWMKKVSQELDPDAYKQLERFRKVQEYVKKSKAAFDRQKLDCLQKVDLLAAARCNMFSRALILYQSTLLKFTEKSIDKFENVAKGFKGYQHYNFSVVKELAELKPAKNELEPDMNSAAVGDGNANKDFNKLLDIEETTNTKKETDAVTDEQIMKPDKNEHETKLIDDDDFLLGGDENILDVSMNTAYEESSLAQSNNSSALLAGLMKHTSERPNDIFLPSQLLSFSSRQLSSPFSTDKSNNIESQQKETSATQITSSQNNKPSWLDLFAELDPLANPDAVGNNKNEEDRNC